MGQMNGRIVLLMSSHEEVDWLRRRLKDAGFDLVCVQHKEDLLAVASMSGIALFLLMVDEVGCALPELVFGIRSNSASMAPVMVLVNLHAVLGVPGFSILDVDDFLFGAWGWEEVAPRILSLCGGASPRGSGKRHDPYGFQLTRSRLAVEYAGREVILSPSEFEIARVLVRHLDAPVPRLMLPSGARGCAEPGGGRSLDVLVSRLRKKLDSIAGGDFCLRSVSRVGYRLGRVRAN